VIINSGVSQGINKRLSAVKIAGYINQNNLAAGVEAFEIYGEIQPGIQNITIVQ
jgi:hypothetical protein